MIRVLIADDHVLIREGLKKIFARHADIEVAGEAASAQEAIELARKSAYDVAVLDINMPGRDGLDALRELKRGQPKLPVLILSMHPEERFAVRMLKAGAAGYLTKESAADELVNAVRKVIAGGKYISPAVAEQLALDLNRPELPHEALSDRELQVLRLIASGKSTREIAETLSLGISTINTYRARVLEKMNLHSDVELTRYAVLNHLVD
ncbi:MAG TPA: response regulator transcription factor [Burkholderiales bacterium]|nr:response regulator transcription factor [Burkholderiales bacterium]